MYKRQGLYFWLAGMPPEQMAQMIGLLGSGLIVSVIVLFLSLIHILTLPTSDLV